MIHLEAWAKGPKDKKAHLYFDDGHARVRRLCHRARFERASLVDPGDTARCRLCQNIRGLIPTRRAGLRGRRKVARP